MVLLESASKENEQKSLTDSTDEREVTCSCPTGGAEGPGPGIYPLSHCPKDSKERVAGVVSVAPGDIYKVRSRTEIP